MQHKINWEAIQALALTRTMSLREIARNAGISPSTVMMRSKREGWFKRPVSSAVSVRERGCEQVVKTDENEPKNPQIVSKSVSNPVSVVSIVQNHLENKRKEHEQRMLRIVSKHIEHAENASPEDNPRQWKEQISAIDQVDRTMRRTLGMDSGESGSGNTFIINTDALNVLNVNEVAEPL